MIMQMTTKSNTEDAEILVMLYADDTKSSISNKKSLNPVFSLS